MNVWFGRNDVEYPSRQFHNAEAVFKSFVGRSRIDKVGHRQLVNVAKPLDRARVENPPFIAVQSDEDVNGVSDFVVLLRGQPVSGLSTLVLFKEIKD